MLNPVKKADKIISFMGNIKAFHRERVVKNETIQKCERAWSYSINGMMPETSDERMVENILKYPPAQYF